MLRISLVSLVLLLSAGCLSPSSRGGPIPPPTEPPQRYSCPRASGPIAIDGRLDEPAWQNAPWTQSFVDIEGARKPQPPLKTQAKLLWNDEFLYIGAEVQEPHVWATLKHRDEIVFHDNDFEVFIDPDGDTREYYEIEINALNTIFDLFLVRTYNDGGPALHAWDCKGMKSAVHVDGTLNDPTDVDRGWTVEMALPWKTLAEAAHRPAPPTVGDTWRMNFSRVEWQQHIVQGRYEKVQEEPENNWVWCPQGVIDIHIPQRWGYVEFVSRAAQNAS